MRSWVHVWAFSVVFGFGAVMVIVTSPAEAQQTEVRTFEIAPQSLSSALLIFAEQSGLEVLFDARIAEGKSSPGVRGSHTPEQALDQMLDGTGLRYRFVGGNTVNLMHPSNPQSARPVTLNAITITGQLLERTLQDTHSSVAAISGEALESRSGGFYDLIERTPGITALGGGTQGFSIRGISQIGVGGSGNGLLISTTVDGATVSNVNQLTFFGPYSTWDLEQIEVLRGPQSTQTGRNALAGAVVIRSKDPVYEHETKVRVEAGSRDTFGGAFIANAPLIDDRLALRLSVDTRETDGWVVNPTLGTDEYDAREETTVRASLRFDPADSFGGVLKISRAENFGGHDIFDFATWPERRLNRSDEEAREGSEIDTYNLRLGFDMNSTFRLESETTFLEADYSRVEDGDDSPLPVGTIFRFADVENIQQEVKLLFETDRVNGVLGAFYTDVSNFPSFGGRLPAQLLIGIPGIGSTITFNVDEDVQTENYALFGELEYRLTPKVKLIGGVRYDNEALEFESNSNNSVDNPALVPFLPPSVSETRKTDFDAFLPKLGIVYDLAEDVSLGFTVQRGYRAGGSQNTFFGLNEYDPEYTWNYETSLRSQWMERRLTFNANVFYTDWTDQQISVATSIPNEFVTENAGESTLYGGEVELQYRSDRTWDMFASLAYVKTKFDDFGEFTGNEFPFAPRVTAAAGITRHFSNGAFVSTDVSYTDEAFTGVGNVALTKSDSRLLVNARVGYEGENGEVFAYARNLFDKDYILSASSNMSGGISRIRAGEPLTLGVVGIYYFDP